MVAPITGHKAKMYRNTGSVATPVWSEIDEVGDVSIADLTMNWAELKRRGNSFAKGLASIIGMIAVEARLIYGLDATNYDAIRAAALAGTVEQYAIMNGDITTSGNEGMKIPLGVENFPWDQPLEDVVGHDVRWVCAYMIDGGSEVDPAWYTVP